MKKNLLKSAALALTLTSVIVTSTAPTFAASTEPAVAYSAPEPAVAYSTSATISQEELLAMAESLNEKITIVKDLYGKLEIKRQELERIYTAGVTEEDVAVFALRALHSSYTAEIVSQLESNLAELTAQTEELYEIEGIRHNLEAFEAYRNALNTKFDANMELSKYKLAAGLLKDAINSFEAKANS